MKHLLLAVMLLALAIPVLAADHQAMSSDQAAAASTTTTTSAAAAPAAMPADQALSMYQQNFLRSYYGISDSDLAAWHARGYSDADIAMAANVAANTGATTAQILALRDQGMSWDQIARQYNMSVADITRIAPAPLSQDQLAFQRSYLMRTYGLSEAEVNSLQQMGYSADEIAMAASLAARANKPIADVLALRRQGLSWTQVAQRYNLQPEVVAMPFASVPSEEDAYFRNFLRDRFSMSAATYDRLRAMGWSPAEIQFAAHVAARSRQSPEYVLQLRQQGLSWTEIASRLGISVAALSTPSDEMVAGVMQRERMMAAPTAINEARRYDHKQWGSQPYVQQSMAREHVGERMSDTERVGSQSGESQHVY